MSSAPTNFCHFFLRASRVQKDSHLQQEQAENPQSKSKRHARFPLAHRLPPGECGQKCGGECQRKAKPGEKQASLAKKQDIPNKRTHDREHKAGHAPPKEGFGICSPTAREQKSSTKRAENEKPAEPQNREKPHGREDSSSVSTMKGHPWTACRESDEQGNRNTHAAANEGSRFLFRFHISSPSCQT